MGRLPPDANAGHSMRQTLREAPCLDCLRAPVRGCIGGMFPSWVVEVVNGAEYTYAIQCPQLVAHKRMQQPTPPPRTTRRRK